jgi:hypothetical protein
MFTINKNEKKDAYISVKDKHAGGNVTVASATFEVFDMIGVSKQGSASATIGDNGTATPDIYGLVDATAGAIVAGVDHEIVFTVTIGTQIFQHRKQMYCEDVRY